MEIKVDEASATATIRIDGTFGPEELVDLLGKIAQARGKIAPVPALFDPATTKALVGPADGWGYYTDLHNGSSLLLLRHPGFGWIGNHLPLPEAVKLAGALHTQATLALLAGLNHLASVAVARDPEGGAAPVAPIAAGSGPTGGQQGGGGKLH